MRTTDIAAKTLAELGENVREAEKAFLEASTQEGEARRATSAALNRLNEHQRKFDEFIGQMKAASPAPSDWKLTGVRGHRLTERTE